MIDAGRRRLRCEMPTKQFVFLAPTAQCATLPAHMRTSRRMTHACVHAPSNESQQAGETTQGSKSAAQIITDRSRRRQD
jgi:hypothetical protein